MRHLSIVEGVLSPRGHCCPKNQGTPVNGIVRSHGKGDSGALRIMGNGHMARLRSGLFCARSHCVLHMCPLGPRALKAVWEEGTGVFLSIFACLPSDDGISSWERR